MPRELLDTLARSKDLFATARALTRAASRAPRSQWLHLHEAPSKLRRLLRNSRETQLILESGLFDRKGYLEENKDVARAGVDPLQHFLNHGGREGRSPHPLFDSLFYLAQFPDVAAAGINPLVHFLNGGHERRRPHPLFDPTFYLDKYPDVAKSGLNPLVHYMRYGAAQMRETSPEVDLAAHVKMHPDARPNPLLHYANQYMVRNAKWRTDMSRWPRRALVVDATLLTPDRDSGSITTLEILKALQSLGYAVTFIPADLRRNERYASALEDAGFACLTAKELRSIPDFLSREGWRFDAVVLCRVDVAGHLIEAVRMHCPDAVVIFETIDLHFLRLERQALLANDKALLKEAASTRAVELSVVRGSDVTLVHSDIEEAILHKETPAALIQLLPYVVDVRGRTNGFTGRRDIVFLGGYRHEPNIDAVTWFAREVFPLVRKEIPEARFVIVGSEPTSEVLALEGKGVVVRGYIEDLRAMFESCRLTVAPLRYGAGYKGKIAMSLAHGVPCVATSIAAEGMQLTVGHEILVADEAAAIASAVARLYSDAQLWERLSRAGLDFAAERFSAHAARHKIDLTLRMAGAKAWPDSTIVPAIRLEKDPGIAIFPSRFMRDLHRKGGVAYRRAALVPHGVDFAHPEDAPRAPRDRLVNPGELRLLFTGRVTEIKGVRTAIEAVRVISDALPDLGVRLTIVGDQTDEGYVEHCRGLVHELELQGRVFFEPSLPEKELFALFQAHDVLVFPSLFEPFALTLILAMEAGIPVVASIAGGTVDIVRERSTGMLFQPGDARGLAAAVVELASDPVLRAVVSQGGRAAASPLTIENMVDRIEVELREAST